MENKKLENQYDAEGRTVTSVSEESKLDEAIAWARDMAFASFVSLSLFEEQRFENVANWLEDYKDVINNLDERISTLYEDCENGAADDVVLGWNKALDKVRELLKAGVE